MTAADVIVVGGGGIGSAAACHLARRGMRVVVLDRFPIGHDRGSSHGQTRLIRLAYFEHADYVPLLRRSYELWRQLEAATGERLLVENGLLMAGPPEGDVIRGAAHSAAVHGLAIDRMTASEAMRRFPAFSLPEPWSAIFEPRGGQLLVESCVHAHASEAIRAGARFETGTTVRDWRDDGREFVVETDRGLFSGPRLVLAPGGWAAGLLRLGSPRLRVLRKSLFWYRPPPMAAAEFVTDLMPCFAFDAPEGFFYGFPAIDDRGVKLAEHSGGRDVADPLSVDRTIDPIERQRVEAAFGPRLPGLGNELAGHAVCLYTMTPDRHFLVGIHPDHAGVAIAAGFSGHGFKFASAMGEVLADLVEHGRTGLPVGFLSPDRKIISRP